MPYYPKTNYSRRPVTKSRGLNRRWYVDATVPKGVPFIGGSSFKAGSGTLTKRSIQNLVRNTLLENKQKLAIDRGEISMTHNTLYTFNPFGNIPISTGDNSRVSDTIHVKSVKISGTINTLNFAAKDTDVIARFLWIKHDAEYLSGSSLFSAGLGSSELFLEGTSTMLHGIIDSDRCTVLADKTFRMPHYISSIAHQQKFDFDMPIGASGIKMQYKTPTSNYGKTYNYYLVGMVAAYGKVSGVTVIGGVVFDSVVNFVDSQ